MRRLVIAGAVAVVAMAAVPVVPAADLEAGRRKAEACATCHGPDGNSTNPKAPSLAGQVPIYLHWQLLLYRDRRRLDPEMTPIAAGLSDADMADLAAFFAAQTPAAPAPKAVDAARLEAGRQIADQHHCSECHGRDLGGRDYAPRLRGLSHEYLLSQMRAFKSRTRNGLDGIMTSSAQPLSDAEIEALAEYIDAVR